MTRSHRSTLTQSGAARRSAHPTAARSTQPTWYTRLIWLAMIGLLAGCQSLTQPTAPAPAGAPPTVAAASPIPPTSPPPTVAAASPISPTSPPPASPVPPSIPVPSPTRPPAPPTSAPGLSVETIQIEGQRLSQLLVAGEGRRYATTAAGLYALNGAQFERRSTGAWPYLVPVGPTTLLSGDHYDCTRGGAGSPLSRSVDGGRTWQAAQVTGARQPLQARPISTLGADLFAVSCEGVYRSTDSGATWSRLPIVGPDNQVVDLATTPDGRRLYLVLLFGEAGTTRLAVSERQGDGWTTARTVRETWGSGVVTIGTEAGTAIVYFGSPLGLETSRDGGTTWQRLSTGLDSTILLVDPRRANLPPAEEAKLRRGVGIHSLAARLDRPRVLLGGLDGLYLLSDGRWQRLQPLANQIVREITLDSDSTVYARTDLGVFRLRGL